MKTKVRIQNYESNGYNMKSFQFIEHPYKDSLIVNVIGYAIFQEYNGEFYNPMFKMETNSSSDVSKMLRIMRAVEKSYDTDHKVLFEELNCEEYVIRGGEWVSVNDHGKTLYKVMRPDCDGKMVHYTTLVAKNEAAAKRRAKKMGYDNFEVIPKQDIQTW